VQVIEAEQKATSSWRVVAPAKPVERPARTFVSTSRERAAQRERTASAVKAGGRGKRDERRREVMSKNSTEPDEPGPAS
jgi:hypothetical protein